MLQEILKQATDKQHQQLEQMMFVDQIMNGTLSFKQYKKILLTNYLVHACFETRLFEGLDPDVKDQLNINSRIKLPALLLDMKEAAIELPETIDNLKNTDELFLNNAASLGAMYVLEGATLGGSVIVKRLKVNPNFQNLNLNFHYYQVYGAELISNWKQFCQVLNTKVNPDAYDTSINAALKLFSYFESIQQAKPAAHPILQP